MKKTAPFLFAFFAIFLLLSVPRLIRRNSLFGRESLSDSTTSAAESEPLSKAPYHVSATGTNAAESRIADDQEEVREAETMTDTAAIPTKEEYFSDTLFIGDSRTVGLMEYADLDTATFFATSGLSSFSAFKKHVDVPGIGEILLEDLLTQYPFGKIYIMLGINELGYPFSSIVSQYTHVVETVQHLCPDTSIILCANLHVVNDGTEKRDYVANDAINSLNMEIEALAQKKQMTYLDANPLFDDETGGLNPDFAADDTHPYGKYYYTWAEWIYETGIS